MEMPYQMRSRKETHQQSKLRAHAGAASDSHIASA